MVLYATNSSIALSTTNVFKKVFGCSQDIRRVQFLSEDYWDARRRGMVENDWWFFEIPSLLDHIFWALRQLCYNTSYFSNLTLETDREPIPGLCQTSCIVTILSFSRVIALLVPKELSFCKEKFFMNYFKKDLLLLHNVILCHVSYYLQMST